MKLARRLTLGSGRVWLGAAVIAAALFMVGRDRTPTYGTNPEIGPSLSATSATWPASAILLVRGGHFSSNTPCVPGDSDPTTICIRVWAKNVTDSTGVSGFQVHFTYPTNMVQVSNAQASPTWLGSTGRSAACPPPSFVPGDGTIYCNTLQAPPPFGPTGSGLLGTIAIESQDVIGPATINLSDGTFMVNTPPDPNQCWPNSTPCLMPATVRSLNLYVAPCADLAQPYDGKVTVSDILYVISKFHRIDAGADLNGDGSVTVADILVAVGEFNMLCWR